MAAPTVVPTQERQVSSSHRTHSRHTSLRATTLKKCTSLNTSADPAPQGTSRAQTAKLHGGPSAPFVQTTNRASRGPITSSSVAAQQESKEIRSSTISREDERQIRELVSPSTSPVQEAPREQFKAFGIKAYPTRAVQNVICRDFMSLHQRCPHGNRCYCIHPLDKPFYRRQIFTKNHNPTGHESTNSSTISSSDTSIILEQGEKKASASGDAPVPRVKLPLSPQMSRRFNIQKDSRDVPFAPRTSSSVQPQQICDIKTTADRETLSDSAWDPQTGVWDYPLDSNAWTDTGNSSDDSSLTSSLFSTAHTTSSRSSVVDLTETETAKSENVKFPRPRFSDLCRNWLHGQCNRAYCSWTHTDREYEDAVPEVPSPAHAGSSRTSMAGEPEIASREVIKHPRPRFAETCRDWQRGRCIRVNCYWIHEDRVYEDATVTTPASLPLKPAEEYDLRVPQSSLGFTHPQTQRLPYVPRKPPESLWTTVHDHIKLKLGAGFEVQGVITGFETSWIFIGNIPSWVTANQITRLVQAYGSIVDVRLPNRVESPAMTVKVHLSTAEEASRACAALNGTQTFDTKITCRLSVHDPTKGHAVLHDTTVRVQWEAPAKVGYGGYPNLERANQAIAATRVPYNGHYAKANIHTGLPVLGVVTVYFQGLPLDADEAGMERFAEPEDVMWERPNYTSLGRATNGVKRFLEDNQADLLQLDVRPPPYKEGMIRAYAHFASPAGAEAACRHLNGRKPAFTGHTKITARHIKSISYAINTETYDRVSCDIDELCQSVWRDWGGRSSVLILPRTSSMCINVKLCGEDVKELGRLKLEFERILAGDIVQKDGKVAWDDFFGRPAGFAFLQDLGREHPAVNTQRNIARRTLRLFGPSRQRAVVRQKIFDKLSQLREQRVHVIRLDGHLIGPFMNADLIKLQEDLGPENVVLNLWRRSLDIRGDDLAYKSALEVVNRARQQHLGERSAGDVVCPVCLDAVSLPVSLCCGHSWCRSCLEGYLRAAINQKFFPLTCLGNDAQCAEKIPLEIARSILPVNDFEMVINAAFSAHVHTHPDEFHFCPSPDCQQVYRSAPQGTVVQCPSCLIRICPSCQSEAHDGLACTEANGGENLFKEWAKSHNIKNCPGCNIAIERAEGCNHVTCTQCQTHVCWACMETFPGGEGIYSHMRIVHGGFGLGPIE